MGIEKRSYLDLSEGQRKEAAATARQQLQTVLANPVASDEQRKAAIARMSHLEQWENGTLPLPEEAPRQAVDHVVSLTESVSVDEDLS